MTRLPQRFRALRTLGEGAVGVVYEAWDEVRAERLALKTLHKASPAAIRGFKREFRTVASLSHENLVVLHELFCEDERWFFTMELVEGKPLLGDQLPERLPASVLRERFAQLASGVDALHQAGVVHRDIKPQNVLVENGGRVVLLDFGMATELAGAVPSAVNHNGFAGSPGYVAPEQVFGESLTFASDWYSFGCVLYEALTGLLPFEDGREAILLRKLSHAPTPPSRLAPDVPEDLERLCLRLLARAPERRPDARSVLESLGEAGPASRPSVIPSRRRGPPVFIGREEERRAIGDWLGAAGERPRVTVLSGSSGIGKTTLAEAIIEPLRAEDVLVLSARCRQDELVPFNAWDGMMDELSHVLDQPEPPRAALRMSPALWRLFPVLSPRSVAEDEAPLAGDPAELRSEGVRALRELLLDLCGERRILLFIDNLHWADADSLRLLRELVSSAGAPPLSVLVTLRPGERESTHVETLLAEPELRALTRWFRLGPLPPAESIQLIESLAVLDAELQGAVLAEANGNPFLLAELSRDAGELRPGSRLLLEEVLERRLRQLVPRARALFEMIGVLGHPLPLAVALSAAGIGERGLEDLHRLRALGLIRWSGQDRDERVEPYHDIWRSALDVRINPARRHECFAALAEAYVRRGRAETDAEVLATCYRECGQAALAARFALTAAQTARAAFAFDRASDGYVMALELGSWQPEERAQLLMELGEAANAAGRGARAGRAFCDAAALTPDRGRMELLRRAAQAFMATGHQHDGELVLRDVLRAVGRTPPASTGAAIARYLVERWRLRRRGLRRSPAPLDAARRQSIEAADVASALWMNHKPILSWTYAMQELRWALDGDDDRLLLRAASRELMFASTEVHERDWIEALVDLGNGLVQRVEDLTTVALYRFAMALRTFLAGDWSQAMTQAREVERLLRTSCTGVHWELALVRRTYVAAIQIEGDMVAAEPLIREWLEDAEHRDDTEGIVTHLLGLGYCYLSRDEPEQVRPVVQRLRSLVSRAHSGVVNVDWIEAMTLCYEGGPPAALAQVLERIRRVHGTEHGRVLLYRVWSRGYEGRVLAALAQGTSGAERARWLQQLATLQSKLAREKWQYATSEVYNIEASLAWFQGDRARAARALDDSARISTRTGARLFAASARLVQALLLADAAAAERARATLRALNVTDIERMVRAHQPAFWPLPGRD